MAERAIAYGIASACVVFWIVKAVTGLRVNESEELAGLDIAEHGMAAYPELLNIGVSVAMPAPLQLRFVELKLAVEVSRTGAAVSTYNILLGEGRRVAAALIAVT